MTELRNRGGGGGNPDSADNISDKVKRAEPNRTEEPAAGLPFRPRPRNKFLRLLPAAVAGLCARLAPELMS